MEPRPHAMGPRQGAVAPAAPRDPARPAFPDRATDRATDRAADRVDQVVFRWAGNRGARGAGIAAVAHSCSEREARVLAEELGPVLRVRGSERRTSIVRHRHGERVLLLRRTPGHDDQGRDSTVCHALLGPPQLLRPLYCLSLGTVPWAEDGWAERVVGAIEPMSRERLRELAGRMRERLEDNVRLVELPLRCLVAQFLRTPQARVSAPAGDLDRAFAEACAVAPPDPGEPPQELPEPAFLALWGLCRIFGPWLGGRDSWTFATFDTVDDHPHRVVFVPSWRGSPEEDTRLHRIDLLDTGTDEAAQIATSLVDHYLRWSPASGDYVRPLDQVPEAATAPDEQRIPLIVSRLWPARAEQFTEPDPTPRHPAPHGDSGATATGPTGPTGGADAGPSGAAPATTGDGGPYGTQQRGQPDRAGTHPSAHPVTGRDPAPAHDAHPADSPAGSTHVEPATPAPDKEATAHGDSGHAGSGHAGSGHAGSGHAGSGHAGSGHAASGHVGSGLTGSGHAGSGHAGSGVMGSGHAGSGHAGSGHAGSGHAGSGHAGSGHAESGHTGSGLTGPGQTASGLTGSGLAGSGLTGSGMAGAGRLGSAGEGGGPGGPVHGEPRGWGAAATGGAPAVHPAGATWSYPPPVEQPVFPPPPPAPPPPYVPADPSFAGPSLPSAPRVPPLADGSMDRLTRASRAELEAHALPAFLSMASVAPSAVPKWKWRSSKEPRERAREAEIRSLVEDLTRVSSPTAHTQDLRRSVEERLERAHHQDLLLVLEERMTYGAQNMVLERLPQAVRVDDAAHDLLRHLLAVDFVVTPAPGDEALHELHMRRVARMVCWFFQWLVPPRADAHAEALARFLGGLAFDEGRMARLVVEELLIDVAHDRIPELPGRVWLAVVRGLYERCGGSGSPRVPAP